MHVFPTWLSFLLDFHSWLSATAHWNQPFASVPYPRNPSHQRDRPGPGFALALFSWDNQRMMCQCKHHHQGQETTEWQITIYEVVIRSLIVQKCNKISPLQVCLMEENHEDPSHQRDPVLVFLFLSSHGIENGRCANANVLIKDKKQPNNRWWSMKY